MFYLVRFVPRIIAELEHGELHPSDYDQLHRIVRSTVVRCDSEEQAVLHFREALGIERPHDFSVTVSRVRGFGKYATLYKGSSGNYYHNHSIVNTTHNKNKNIKKKRQKMATTNTRGTTKGGIVMDEVVSFDETKIKEMKEFAEKYGGKVKVAVSNNNIADGTINTSDSTISNSYFKIDKTGKWVGPGDKAKAPEVAESTELHVDSPFSEPPSFNKDYGEDEELTYDPDGDGEDYYEDLYVGEDHDEASSETAPSTEEMHSFIDEILKVKSPEDDALPDWARSTAKEKAPNYNSCCWRCEGPLPKGRGMGNACDKCYEDLEKE